MALDRRSPLDDLMASLAFEERQFQPLTRSHGERKHDLAGCRSTRIQYTAGSGPAWGTYVQAVNRMAGVRLTGVCRAITIAIAH